jgi:hypothetical protein
MKAGIIVNYGKCKDIKAIGEQANIPISSSE